MRNIVIVHDLEDGYYQAVWFYEREGRQVIHTFSKGLASTTWHNVEILLAHGYPVEPKELLAKLKSEGDIT